MVEESPEDRRGGGSISCDKFIFYLKTSAKP